MDAQRIRVSDDESLQRRRLVVLFRAVLFIPAFVVLTCWSLAAVAVLVVAWLLLLVGARLPLRLHRFLAAYLRYGGQTTAWLFLLSDRYPRPRGTRAHPFVVEVPDPTLQSRLVTVARALLVVPPLVLATALRVVLMLSSVAAWFAGLALGRTTVGLQELGTFCLRYELETEAYALLLTPRYPRLAPE